MLELYDHEDNLSDQGDPTKFQFILKTHFFSYSI